MRVAVCISGHLRNFKSGYKNFKENFILINSDHTFDFFIDTWDNLDWRNENIFKETADIIPHVKTLYSPIKINVEKFINWDTEEYMKYVSNQRWVKKGIQGKRSKGEHILGMYYKIFKCNNLKKEKEDKDSFKYDIVIRSRTDMGFSSPVKLDVLANIDEIIYVPQCSKEAKDNGILIRDMFAISSSKNMDYYCDLFNKINEILESTRMFRPEPMLYHYLDKNSKIGIAELENNWFLT